MRPFESSIHDAFLRESQPRLPDVLACSCRDGEELPLPVADLQRTDPVNFASEIVPILKQNCLACHHEKEAEGGLNLETLESMFSGGDSGHGVVPKDVSSSLLFVRAIGAEEPLMPPEDNSVGAKPLSPDELGLLKLWIEQGASGSNASASESIDWQPIPETIRTVYAMDVSPNGGLAAVGRGNRVVVFDLATNEEVARLVDPSLTVGQVADVDLIQSIAFSPDAERIATGGFRTVRIWRSVSPPVDPSSTPLFASSGLVAVKADESQAAMVNAIGDIELWDLTSNQRRHSLQGHVDRISGLAWAGSTARVFSCDPTGRLVLWQAESGEKMAQLETNLVLDQLSASPNGVHVAAVDGEHKVKLFRCVEDGKSLERVNDAVGEVNDATAVTLIKQDAPIAVVASEAGGVMVVNLADNKVIRKIDHGSVVDALAVTADSTRLVTGGRDGKTRVWNLADGKPLLTMEGDPQSRLQVAEASRDAARQKAAVARLNAKTAELEKLLAKENEVLVKATEEHKKATETLAAEEKKRLDAVAIVSATETTIAKSTADATKATATIDAATKTLAAAKSTSETVGKEIESRTADLRAVEAEAAKAKQQLDAISKALEDANARAKKIEEEIAAKQAAVTKAKEDAAKAQAEIDAANKLAAEAKAAAEKANAALEAQKKSVAASEEAKKKSEADLAKRQQALDTATAAQQRAAANVPAHQALIESETRRQALLDQTLAGVQARLIEPGNEVVSIAISAEDSRIATAHRNGSVRIYRASDGQPLSTFAADLPSESLRVAVVGDLVGRFSIASPPALWSLRAEWRLERTIGAIDDPSIISDRVTALDFRHDGMSIAVGSGPPSRSGEVKVFAVESGRLLRDFGPVHSDTVLGIEFSPDGRQIASSAADKTIRLLDLATGDVARSLEGHTHHVLSVAWQDDGETVASASADQSVKIWNTLTGEQRRTIGGGSKEITAVEFVQTSNQVAAACADGQVRLYDSSNGKAIRTFNASGDFLFTLSVTPDGKKLLAAGQSGVVRVWTVADGKLIHEMP